MDAESQSLISTEEEEQVLARSPSTRPRWFAAAACIMLAGTMAAALFRHKAASNQTLASDGIVGLQEATDGIAANGIAPIDPGARVCHCSDPPPGDGLWATGDEGVIAVCRVGGSDGQEHCCEKTHFTECGPADVAPIGGECSDAGEGCLSSRCCEDESLQCFKKNDEWADCKPSCTAGEADPNSPTETQSPWSCEVLSRNDGLDVRPIPDDPNTVYCDANATPKQLCPGGLECMKCSRQDGHCPCAPAVLSR